MDPTTLIYHWNLFDLLTIQGDRFQLSFIWVFFYLQQFLMKFVELKYVD